MPVRATAVIRILSTTAGVVTLWVLRKMWSFPMSYAIRDDEDACRVYTNLRAHGQLRGLNSLSSYGSMIALTRRSSASSARMRFMLPVMIVCRKFQARLCLMRARIAEATVPDIPVSS
jgi:hypothetical protein